MPRVTIKQLQAEISKRDKIIDDLEKTIDYIDFVLRVSDREMQTTWLRTIVDFKKTLNGDQQ